MKKVWSPRVMQRWYKEWALCEGAKLLGKVRNNLASYPTVVGEVYRNGRTYTTYKGDSIEAAKEAVLMEFAQVA